MTVYKFSWQQHPLSAVQMMDKYFLVVWLPTWGHLWLANHFWADLCLLQSARGGWWRRGSLTETGHELHPDQAEPCRSPEPPPGQGRLSLPAWVSWAVV